MDDMTYLTTAIRAKWQQLRARAREGDTDRGALSLELAILIACLAGLALVLVGILIAKANQKNAVIQGQ